MHKPYIQLPEESYHPQKYFLSNKKKSQQANQLQEKVDELLGMDASLPEIACRFTLVDGSVLTGYIDGQDEHSVTIQSRRQVEVVEKEEIRAIMPVSFYLPRGGR